MRRVGEQGFLLGEAAGGRPQAPPGEQVAGDGGEQEERPAAERDRQHQFAVLGFCLGEGGGGDDRPGHVAVRVLEEGPGEEAHLVAASVLDGGRDDAFGEDRPVGDCSQGRVAQGQAVLDPGEDRARPRAGAVEDPDFRRPGGEVVFAEAVEAQPAAVRVVDEARGSGDAPAHRRFERVEPRFGVLVGDEDRERAEPDRHRGSEEQGEGDPQPAQAGDRG